MAFRACTFSYNGVDSSTFGLKIGSINNSGVSESMGSTSVNIKEVKPFRKQYPYFYGLERVPVLSFDVEAFSEDDIDEDFLKIIERDYFSSKSYQPLYIHQDDMMNVFYMAILSEPRVFAVGNLPRGIRFTVRCNAPFGWYQEKTTTYNFSPPLTDEAISFFNGSDDSGSYLYPKSLVITMSATSGNVSIVNTSDSDREVSFTGLSSNEVLTINCELQTISSSTALNRLSLSNKKFLRLVPGINNMEVTGEVSSIAMTTQFISKKLPG